MKRFIIVNLKFEGIHQWDGCKLDDVWFLKNPHRHIFHITCKKEVTHNDRQIEIILLKRQILTHLKNQFPNNNLGNRSCEYLCEHLINKFDLSYCSVLEDGENGAEIFTNDV